MPPESQLDLQSFLFYVNALLADRGKLRLHVIDLGEFWKSWRGHQRPRLSHRLGRCGEVSAEGRAPAVIGPAPQLAQIGIALVQAHAVTVLRGFQPGRGRTVRRTHRRQHPSDAGDIDM
jgi:hypothetical protein